MASRDAREPGRDPREGESMDASGTPSCVFDLDHPAPSVPGARRVAGCADQRGRRWVADRRLRLRREGASKSKRLAPGLDTERALCSW